MKEAKELANLTQEVQLFRRMVTGELPERILLIEAPSGHGKTSLLKKLETEYESKMLTVYVDLKSHKADMHSILSRIRRKIGETRFKYFDKAVQQFFIGGLQVTDNVLSGKENQLQVILNISDDYTRNQALNKLQEVFFQDLGRISKPILLILDTFDGASETLAQWIGGNFLTEASETQNVWILVAGQQVPQPTGEWQHCTRLCRLERIADQEAWYKYAKNLGLPFNRDEIGMAVRIFDGLPSEIVKTLERLKLDKKQAL